MNETFELLKETFESEKVMITLADDIIFELAEGDISEVQNYFMMFDYLLALIDG